MKQLVQATGDVEHRVQRKALQARPDSMSFVTVYFMAFILSNCPLLLLPPSPFNVGPVVQWPGNKLPLLLSICHWIA